MNDVSGRLRVVVRGLLLVGVAGLLASSLVGPWDAAARSDQSGERVFEAEQYGRMVHNQSLRTTIHFPLRVDRDVDGLRVAVLGDSPQSPPVLMARMRFGEEAFTVSCRRALATRVGDAEPGDHPLTVMPAWRSTEVEAIPPDARQVVLETGLIDEFGRRLDRGVIIDVERREIVYWLRFHDTLGRDPSWIDLD